MMWILSALVVIWFVVAMVQSVRVYWYRLMADGWRAVALEYQKRPSIAPPKQPASWSAYGPAVWDDSHRDKAN